MKMLFKIILRLISWMSCILEFAGCLFYAMHSPSPFIESIQWILVPMVVITLLVAYYPYSSLYQSLKDRQAAKRKAKFERARHKQQLQAMWEQDYAAFYKEMHCAERNYYDR